MIVLQSMFGYHRGAGPLPVRLCSSPANAGLGVLVLPSEFQTSADFSLVATKVYRTLVPGRVACRSGFEAGVTVMKTVRHACCLGVTLLCNRCPRAAHAFLSDSMPWKRHAWHELSIKDSEQLIFFRGSSSARPWNTTSPGLY